MQRNSLRSRLEGYSKSSRKNADDKKTMHDFIFSFTHTHPQKHLYLFIYLFERKRERASERESFHLLAYFPKAIMMRVRQQPGARISQAGGRNPSTWAITTISWVYIRRKLESEADTGVQIQELQDEMLASKPASSLLSLKFTFQLHLPQTFQSPSVILDCSASPFFSSGQCKQSYHLLHRELSQPAASMSFNGPWFPWSPCPTPCAHCLLKAASAWLLGMTVPTPDDMCIFFPFCTESL